MDSGKKLGTRRKISLTIASIFLFLGLILICGEIVVRILVKPTPYFKKATLDKDLGWRTKADFSENYQAQEQGGRKYDVAYTTTKNGFRAWGDTQSSNPSIFIIGDSYTQAVEVSSGRTYSDLIKDSLEVEIFAYGQAGYGTLQQLMILEEYIQEINPALVILQFCSNDYIDNHVELEKNSGYKVGEQRPYLNEAGELYYSRPFPKWQLLVDKSKFLKTLRQKLQTLSSKENITVQKYINDQGSAFAPYKTAINITAEVMRRIKALVEKNNTKLLVFSADHYDPYVKDFRSTCKSLTLPYTDAPNKALLSKEGQGIKVRTSDGYHWNEFGHQLVAQALVTPIKEQLHN